MWDYIIFMGTKRMDLIVSRNQYFCDYMRIELIQEVIRKGLK